MLWNQLLPSILSNEDHQLDVCFSLPSDDVHDDLSFYDRLSRHEFHTDEI